MLWIGLSMTISTKFTVRASETGSIVDREYFKTLKIGVVDSCWCYVIHAQLIVHIAPAVEELIRSLRR